jgi:hypothetical protein
VRAIGQYASVAPDDLRRADDGGQRRRMGLEGLPTTAADVWTFDVLRSSNASDIAGLATVWLFGVGTAAVALWGGSIVLGGLSAVVIAFSIWWTLAKWRSWADSQRMMRHVAGQEAAEAESE